MSNVIVTGAGGFLGAHVVRKLLDQGDDVTAVDVRSCLLLPPHPRLHVFQLDIGHRPWTPPTFDVIVNLAATADPEEAMKWPVASYKNNVAIMSQVIELARVNGSHVIHVSSNESGYQNGAYGGGKFCQEVVCKASGYERILVLGTQSLFGEFQQRHKFIPVAIGAILDGEPVPIQAEDGILASRPYLYAGNLANEIAGRIESWTRLGGYETYASSVDIPLVKVVSMIADHLRVPDPTIRLVKANQRPGQSARVDVIPTSTQPVSPAFVSFEDGLKKTIDWHFDHRQIGVSL